MASVAIHSPVFRPVDLDVWEAACQHFWERETWATSRQLAMKLGRRDSAVLQSFHRLAFIGAVRLTFQRSHTGGGFRYMCEVLEPAPYWFPSG